jgi:hypothetical protein
MKDGRQNGVKHRITITIINNRSKRPTMMNTVIRKKLPWMIQKLLGSLIPWIGNRSKINPWMITQVI